MKKFLLASLIAGTIAFSSAAPAFAFHTSGPDYNDGPLNIFPREYMTCGRGWRLPVLIWGERPVSVCILKPRRENRFGGSFGF